MRISGFGKKNLLGVDLGTAFVKVAAVYKDRVVAQGSAPVPESGSDDLSKMAGALKVALEQSKARVKDAALAVGGDQVIVRYVFLPKMPEKELRAGLKYEAGRYLPVADQDVVVDFAVLEEVKGEAGKMRVLLAALRRELAEKYCALFAQVGLKLRAIDTVPLAIFRLLRKLGAGGNAIAVDVGEKYSHVLLMEDGKPVFSRAVNIGSREMARTVIPSGLNPAGDLVQEIRRALDFYRLQKRDVYKPEKLLLCGGGARLPEMAVLLEEGLGISSEIVNPFGLGPEYAVAVGLALRER